MRAVLAAAVVAAFFFVLALLADVGLGDLKLSAGLGAALGYCSWSAVAAGVAAGFALAGICAAAALAAGRTRISARLALGPPLLAGTFLALALAA